MESESSKYEDCQSKLNKASSLYQDAQSKNQNPSRRNSSNNFQHYSPKFEGVKFKSNKPKQIQNFVIYNDKSNLIDDSNNKNYCCYDCNYNDNVVAITKKENNNYSRNVYETNFDREARDYNDEFFKVTEVEKERIKGGCCNGNFKCVIF